MECVGSVSRENGRVIKSIGALWPVGVGARPGGSERERNVYSSEGMMRNATRRRGLGITNGSCDGRSAASPEIGVSCLCVLIHNARFS